MPYLTLFLTDKMSFFLAASLLSLLSQQSLATPVRVLDTDFPDPSLIHTDDGYYSFATNGNGVNVQVATSPDFKSWKRLDGYDAVPGPFPDWIADKPKIWAPDVIKRVRSFTSTNGFDCMISELTDLG